MKKSILVMTMTVLILTACGSTATQAPAKPDRTKTPAVWSSIKMTQSGGIAGVSRSITISHDGAGSAIDERTAKTVTLALTAEQLAELDSAVAASKKSSALTPDAACADCFVYILEVTFPNKTRTVQLNDTQLIASGYEPLVTFLRTLMDAALQ